MRLGEIPAQSFCVACRAVKPKSSEDQRWPYICGECRDKMKKGKLDIHNNNGDQLILGCDICGGKKLKLLEIDEDRGMGGRWSYICRECLKKGLAMLENDSK